MVPFKGKYTKNCKDKIACDYVSIYLNIYPCLFIFKLTIHFHPCLATVAKPVISTTADTYSSGPSLKSYSEGGNYKLTCLTDSYSPSLTYTWTKDSVTVGTSRVYEVT